MEKFTQESLRQLAVVSGGPCVSMYVPARRMGANSVIDATRIKNLMRTAESKITAGAFGTDGAMLLSPLYELLNDRSVWNESQKGLAIFLAPGLFRTFRVPVDLEETVTVADRFDVIPLLSLGTDDGAFLLLSLSQNHIRLFRGTRQEFKAIALEKPLSSIEEFLRFVEPSTQQQMHSGMRNARDRRSKQDAVFYGTDSPANQRKVYLHEFFRAIDHKLTHLAEAADTPLLLAGIEYLQAIYRSVSRYPHIVATDIKGNIDGLPLGELHEIGWLLMEPYMKRRTRVALEKLHSLVGTGRTSEGLEEITAGAAEGRIETLFVSTRSNQAGSASTEPKQDDIERIGLIGSVLSTGGEVYPVADGDLRSTTGVAAVMRY